VSDSPDMRPGDDSGFSGSAAIVGLGITELGKVYGPTAPDFAADAALRAIADAGLQPEDVDGFIASCTTATPSPCS
jgi:acetyl-CoA acetyltransferase